MKHCNIKYKTVYTVCQICFGIRRREINVYQGIIKIKNNLKMHFFDSFMLIYIIWHCTTPESKAVY